MTSYFFSSFFVLLSLFNAIELSNLNVKIEENTFETGLDGWKIKSSSWLRMSFSDLKQKHPKIPLNVDSKVSKKNFS